ncbi:2,3-bisphosphoglycerate-independent phosphoglycerate mutase [Patescibacteria group bacterium]|nr:2,3-bisphosphoglycerate-independent phosphoglycerate mutase [Patescibacteria group bacterium]
MPKCALIIIDGFGVAPAGPGNVRSQAKMPAIERLEKEIPNVIMEAAGNAVGLPEGQQGASEPGHYTIGAGRVVWQPLEEINRAIKSGEFYKNEVLVGACKRAKEKGVTLHLLGIYSIGGVHGSVEHMHAMMKLAHYQGVEKVLLHLIGDGRDVPKNQFCTDIELLKQELEDHPNTKIASLVGRYYAMDRDRQYKDRTKVAYDLYIKGECEQCESVLDAAQHWCDLAPDEQKSDYYIKPVKTVDFEPMQEGDVVVGMNFRSDRMIQIIKALEDPDFSEFDRPVRIKVVVCMGPYSDHLPVAYPAPVIKNTLGEVVSDAGKKQLRIAETDKMAHVTFFFNAQHHDPFPNEDRILIESPKVPNYADTPEMSADELTDKLIEQVEAEKYDLIVANYANADLVGHGANLEAAKIACETVDRNLERLLPVLEEHGYEWIVTSDHGNVEDMLLTDGTVSPSHTGNPVQTFVKSTKYSTSDSLKELTGIKDLAPMCLNIMEIKVPNEMQ